MNRRLLAFLSLSAFLIALRASDVVPPRLDFLRAMVTDREFRIAMFRHIDVVFPGRVVQKGSAISSLPRDPKALPASFPWKGNQQSTAEFVSRSRTTGLLVIQDGKITSENYFLGADANSRFTSFSVAKSFTSTLVGLAIADGRIASVNDPVTRYLPDLKGSGYDGVPIKSILQMCSGVKFSEDYSGNDDVSKMFQKTMIEGTQSFAEYARTVQPQEPAGQRFYYRSFDTQVLGLLLQRVLKEPLADYLSRKIWVPAGMESDALWSTDGTGMESGFTFLNVTLRDYGRFGLIFLNKGQWNGRQLIPAAWVEQATRADGPAVQPGKLGADNPLGYGFQWWILPGSEGAFQAEGIFGQFIYVNPAKKTVIVKTSASDAPVDPLDFAQTRALFSTIAGDSE